jgi:hypothetical protein
MRKSRVSSLENGSQSDRRTWKLVKITGTNRNTELSKMYRKAVSPFASPTAEPIRFLVAIGPSEEYRLRSTGEVVVDPDFIANWRVTPGQTD